MGGARAAQAVHERCVDWMRPQRVQARQPRRLSSVTAAAGARLAGKKPSCFARRWLRRPLGWLWPLGQSGQEQRKGFGGMSVCAGRRRRQSVEKDCAKGLGDAAK